MDLRECKKLKPSEYEKHLGPALCKIVKEMEGLDKEAGGCSLPLTCYCRSFRKDIVVISLDLSSESEVDMERASGERLKTEFILLDTGVGDSLEKSQDIRWISHAKNKEMFCAVTDFLYNSRVKRECLESGIYLIKNCRHLHMHRIATVSGAGSILEALRCLEIEEVDFLEYQKDIHRKNFERLQAVV